jgi:hypothetical protein
MNSLFQKSITLHFSSKYINSCHRLTANQLNLTFLSLNSLQLIKKIEVLLLKLVNPPGKCILRPIKILHFFMKLIFLNYNVLIELVLLIL